MMAESDDQSPIFDNDPPRQDSHHNTTDEIGAGDDLNESRDDVEEQNDSTKAVYSDQDVKEEDLDNSDDIPEINSKLTLREETAPEQSNGSHHQRDQNLTKKQTAVSSRHQQQQPAQRKPAEIKPVYIGDQKLRSKLKFEVVTAKVVEDGGKIGRAHV